MTLAQRMASIQRNLKEKQAFLNARPERVAKWVGHLNALYDRLEEALGDEVARGICVVSRTATPAQSDDLGQYDEPGISIEIEGVSYVTSVVRRATNMNPDLVDLKGTVGKWSARLSFIPDSSGERRWAIAAAEHAAHLDKVESTWLTPETFRRAIEPFFPFAPR